MNLNWDIKPFDALSNIELYQILQLRSEVFVVEQNCVYQDVDCKDQKAIHILGKFEDKIIAYCRVFKAGSYFDQAAISRVVVNPKYRNYNLGNQVVARAIVCINEQFNEKKITISAQLYLKKFYENHGFIATSDVYLEDDIDHIQMKIE